MPQARAGISKRRFEGWRHTGYALVLLALVAATSGAQGPLAGRIAPDFKLRALSGPDVKLSALRGRPVVLAFWGTWCPPCRTEFPELIRVHHELRADSLVIIGVNGRDKELSAKDVQRFVDEFLVPFQVALDSQGRTRRAFHLVSVPTTVFIDVHGVVQRVHPGAISRAQLYDGIALIVKRR
ncbi:MAG: TlpA disulfide reductase family protein [Gemmatimonadota bacterium]